MSQLTIYHNPNCTKSRATLALLKDRGLEPRVVEYLKSPPTVAELKVIVERLGFLPEQLLRRNEDIYQAKYAGKTLTNEEWLEAMVHDPILIERPIVVSGQRAAIGRPPENVLAILD